MSMFTCRACGDVHADGTLTCPRLEEPTHPGIGPCGSQIDRYFVERLLGGGGMGAVYRARHVMLDQAMALKLLKPGLASNPDMMERFVREARAAAAIGNPHIVRVSDFGVAPDGRAFLAMELLDGQDLDSAMKSGVPLAQPRTLDIIAQALDGLGAAHKAGIVHRDLKPANIFLCKGADGRDLVKLVDFGVSKVKSTPASSSLTQTGAVMGTPLYMAPEQFKGARDVDARADLYAVGVTLYQMVSGKVPYDAPTYESLVLQIYTEQPKPIRQIAPGIPEHLAAAIEKGMAREPAERWQTADEFAAALLGLSPRAAIGVAATTPAAAPAAHALSTPAAGTPKQKSRKGLWITLLLLSAVGITVGVVASQRRGGGGAAAPAEAAAASSAPDSSAASSAAPVATAASSSAPAAPASSAPASSAPALVAKASPPPDAGEDPEDKEDKEDKEDEAADAAPVATAKPKKPDKPEKPVPVADNAADSADITFDEPEIVGRVKGAPLREAAKKARSSLNDCRPPTGVVKVKVKFFVPDQHISLALPDDEHAPSAKYARCVAARIKEQEPSWPAGVSGIITVEFTLPASKKP